MADTKATPATGDLVERVGSLESALGTAQDNASAQGTALDNHDKTLHELDTRVNTLETVDHDNADAAAKVVELRAMVEEQGRTIEALEAQVHDATSAAASGGSADATTSVLRDFLSTYFRNERGSDATPDAKPLWEKL